MENVRYNISPCEQGEVSAFIGKIDTSVFVPNGTVKATERSHYDRYSFLCNDNRVAVVYDTTACIVSITGRQDYATSLLDLFGAQGKTVKRSTVPAQGCVPQKPQERQPQMLLRAQNSAGMRSKLFVSPDSLRRRSDFAYTPSMVFTADGKMMETDEIFPPQTSYKRSAPRGDVFNITPAGGEIKRANLETAEPILKRPLPSYGESNLFARTPAAPQRPIQKPAPAPVENEKNAGISISIGGRTPTDLPRRAVISFGSEDDVKPVRGAELKISTRTQGQAEQAQTEKRKRGRPPKAQQQGAASVAPAAMEPAQTEKRKRGRPPKSQAAASENTAVEYKNGYSFKNYPIEQLSAAVKRLRTCGKTVLVDGTEFAGTPQEIKSYTVTDGAGQKILLRYATGKKTLQLQGKQSELYGEVFAQISSAVGADNDAAKAASAPVAKANAGKIKKEDKKAIEVQKKLKKRLPVAYDYLSEQSRTDFACGVHDLGQANLYLADYSGLLVTAFRGLERFIFDLQRAEGINVKMIGQAYDKDDSGKYMLKSGYLKRIDKVVYAEVMVALYTEYFSQRNFFSHSDNSDENISRSLPERAVALGIFDHLLDVVEYNAKKLKETGFSTADKRA